jgi:hypothetical protein
MNYFERVRKTNDKIRRTFKARFESVIGNVILLLIDFAFNIFIKLLFAAKIISIYQGYYLPSYGEAFIVFTILYHAGMLFPFFTTAYKIYDYDNYHTNIKNKYFA